jgi:hypothetical protein
LVRALVGALLLLGCLSPGGTATVAVESLHVHGALVPSPVDELPAPIARMSTMRRRIAVARHRFGRQARRVGRVDDARRFAFWLPVQFRLMPPTWRGPTVLRL